MPRRTGITAILRKALGDPPSRGALVKFARQLGTDDSSPSRWMAGARPDPAIWPRIEKVLELPAGTLAAADANPPDDVGAVDELRAEVRALAAELKSVRARLAKLEGSGGRATRRRP